MKKKSILKLKKETIAIIESDEIYGGATTACYITYSVPRCCMSNTECVSKCLVCFITNNEKTCSPAACHVD